MMMIIIATAQYKVINAVTRIYVVRKWTLIPRLRVGKIVDNRDKIREECIFVRLRYNAIYLVSCIFY